MPAPDVITKAPERAEDARAASKPLFDLSDIDVSRVVLTRADLERWNPHRGPIVQLDGVLWHDAGFSKAVGYKDVREDEFWVGGHFPGNPIMPGVLMVESGAQLTSFMFYRRRGEPCVVGFTRIEETIFRGKVRPGDRLLMLSSEVKYRPRIFISRIQGIVEDRLVFESKITGMVL